MPARFVSPSTALTSAGRDGGASTRPATLAVSGPGLEAGLGAAVSTPTATFPGRPGYQVRLGEAGGALATFAAPWTSPTAAPAVRMATSALPDLRLPAPTVAPAQAAGLVLERFLARLPGIHASLDTRMLPLETTLSDVSSTVAPSVGMPVIAGMPAPSSTRTSVTPPLPATTMPGAPAPQARSLVAPNATAATSDSTAAYRAPDLALLHRADDTPRAPQRDPGQRVFPSAGGVAVAGTSGGAAGQPTSAPMGTTGQPAIPRQGAVEQPSSPDSFVGVGTAAGGAVASAQSSQAAAQSSQAAAQSSQAAAQSSSAWIGTALRPGGIASRVERLASLLGIRAAGLSLDFVEPERFGAMLQSIGSLGLLPLSSDATGQVDAVFPTAGRIDMPTVAAMSSSPRESSPTAARAAVASASSIGLPPSVAEAARAAMTGAGAVSSTGAGAVSSTGGAVAAPTVDASPVAGASAAAGPTSDMSSVSSSAPTAPAPASATPPGALAPRQIAALGQRLDAAWALSRVFPAAAPAALSALAADIGSLGPGVVPSALAARLNDAFVLLQGGWARAEARSQGAAPAASAGPAAAASSAAWMPRVAAASVGGGAPSGRAASAPGAAYVTGALDRAALPVGRVPRGSYTWTRASDFSAQFGTWSPPVTVSAAVGGAESVAGGGPAWEGMPAINIAPVREALDEESASAPSLTMLEGGLGRTAAPSTGTGQSVARTPRLAAAQVPPAMLPLLKLIGGSANDSSGSSSSSSSTSEPSSSYSFVPPSAMALVQPPPPSTPARPASDSSARILEALRHQQGQPTDDRVTLADLTLVVTASATQQVAAASQSSSSSSRGGSGGGGGRQGVSGTQSPKMTPEQEQREIEELARRVLSEVNNQMQIDRERTGEPWER